MEKEEEKVKDVAMLEEKVHTVNLYPHSLLLPSEWKRNDNLGPGNSAVCGDTDSDYGRTIIVSLTLGQLSEFKVEWNFFLAPVTSVNSR